jgi:YVTN family beta-propeller protein
VTGRTYGDPGGGAAGPPNCDLLFEVTGGRPPYTWTTTSLAPAPIVCNDPGEGADNAFLRCNSGGAAVSGGTAMLAVEVNDSGSSALGKIALTMDDQMHTAHVINVQNPLQVNVNFSPIPDGVTGRAYGNPVGMTDLIYTSSGGIPPTVNNNFVFMGFPAGIGCMQTTFTEIQCDSAGGDVGAAGTYMPMVTVEDSPNDTTPMATVASDPNSTRTDTLEVNAEIVIDNTSPLVNGMVGQPYNVTFTCDAGGGFCGGTGSPGNAAAMYTWSDDGGMAGVTFPGPFPVAQPGSANFSGAPMAAGVNMVTVSVTDDDGGGNANATTPSCTMSGTCPSVIYNVTVLSPVMLVGKSFSSDISMIDTDPASGTFNMEIANNATTNAIPNGIAFTPDGLRAYATRGVHVAVIDMNPASGTFGQEVLNIPTTCPGGGLSEGGIAITPDGTRAYVVPDLATSNVCVIDTDPSSMTFHTQIATVATSGGGGHTAVAITPDGTRAYITEGFAGLVTVIDTNPASGTFHTEIASIPTGGSPNGIAITPDGLRAYAASTSTGSVFVIDTDPGSGTFNTVLTSVILSGIAPRGIAVRPDGLRAFVTNGFTNNVSVIDTDPNSTTFNTELTTITLTAGMGPTGIALTPDGSRGYLANATTTTASVIDTAANTELVATIPLSGMTPCCSQGVAGNPNPSLHIGTATASTATIGNAYFYKVPAYGGTAPYTFSTDAGGVAFLAAHNMTLTPDGNISSPSVTGPAATLMLNVTVTDSSTPATSVTKTVTLQIM